MSESLKRKIVRRPLYIQVAESLREDVLSKLSAGDQLAAESSLAKQFGVSVMTVREALSALAQEGLVERQHGKGNFVRDPGVVRHVAILNELDLSMPAKPFFFLRLAQALESGLAGQGIPCRHYIGHTIAGMPPPSLPTNEQLLEDLDNGRLSAVIAVSSGDSPEWQRRVASAGIPFIGHEQHDISPVRFDYEGMVNDGVAYLADQGCRRLAMVHYCPSWLDGETSPDVSQFRLAAKAHGVTASAVLHAANGTCDETKDAACLFRAMWDSPETRPDALLVLDDVLFQEIAYTMLSLGLRIPEDLAIITHTNKGSNVFGHLPVARLEVDPSAFAACTVARAVALLRGGTPPDPVVLPATLVPAPTSPDRTLRTRKDPAHVPS